ncbi:hypothetical protein Leryth_005468 [Lithospermum erythrorhizon]|nr:hypothetical protein Leryth_005468 [Lithospermum erythrorhizon]
MVSLVPPCPIVITTTQVQNEARNGMGMGTLRQNEEERGASDSSYGEDIRGLGSYREEEYKPYRSMVITSVLRRLDDFLSFRFPKWESLTLMQTNGSLWTKLDKVTYESCLARKGAYVLANLYLSYFPRSPLPRLSPVLNKKEEESHPFKFFNMWLKHSDFEETAPSYLWLLACIGNTSSDAIRSGFFAAEGLNSLDEAERSFVSGVHVLGFIWGDKGTRYFHAMVKKNGLFGTAIPTFPIDTEMLKVGGVLNADERSALVVPITTNEVKEAIFDIGDDKVPGPDGYSSALFKKNWKIVGEDFVKGVKEFFSCGKFLKQLNHTIVAHIPKTDHDPKVGDFRRLVIRYCPAKPSRKS